MFTPFQPLKPLPGFKLGTRMDIPLRFKEIKEEESRPTHWYGKFIKSQPEWWGLQWLLKEKIDFQFQYAVWGGDQSRGGYTVDFLINTPPRPWPLEFKGDWWHDGDKGANDKFRETQLAAYFKVKEVKYLYGPDLKTQETVFAGMERVIYGAG